MNKKINYGHMGNGITCWFEGTDIKVAHISSQREIQLYYNLNSEQINEVVRISQLPHISVSTSQHENVYSVEPLNLEVESNFDLISINDEIDTNVPNFTCENCEFYLGTQHQVLETSVGPYAVECSNIVYPITDCILKGFEKHSIQPGYSKPIKE